METRREIERIREATENVAEDRKSCVGIDVDDETVLWDDYQREEIDSAATKNGESGDCKTDLFTGRAGCPSRGWILQGA